MSKTDEAILAALTTHYCVTPFVKQSQKPVARAVWPAGWLRAIGAPEILPIPTNLFERLYPASERAELVRLI